VLEYQIKCVLKLNIFKRCENLFLFVVNNPLPRTSIFVDDDSKETNVSTTAANMLFTSDLMDSAKIGMPHNAVAGNAELEELGVLFRDYHKAILSAKAALLLSITRSRRLNLLFQNLIKICS
jgi:hypothetical protein